MLFLILLNQRLLREVIDFGKLFEKSFDINFCWQFVPFAPFQAFQIGWLDLREHAHGPDVQIQLAPILPQKISKRIYLHRLLGKQLSHQNRSSPSSTSSDPVEPQTSLEERC